MLLHAHPVNDDLEQQGALPVNSVWPWGGGVMNPGASQPDQAVWTDDPLARGLSLAHGSRTAPLPDSAGEWLQQAGLSRRQLVVLPPVAADQPQALQQLERDWFAPLASLLRQGSVARLTLHLAGETVHSFTITRHDFLKFWRRARPLENELG
jgi:hypothetical protein